MKPTYEGYHVDWEGIDLYTLRCSDKSKKIYNWQRVESIEKALKLIEQKKRVVFLRSVDLIKSIKGD